MFHIEKEKFSSEGFRNGFKVYTKSILRGNAGEKTVLNERVGKVRTNIRHESTDPHT